jgi:hypothetical protein
MRHAKPADQPNRAVRQAKDAVRNLPAR